MRERKRPRRRLGRKGTERRTEQHRVSLSVCVVARVLWPPCGRDLRPRRAGGDAAPDACVPSNAIHAADTATGAVATPGTVAEAAAAAAAARTVADILAAAAASTVAVAAAAAAAAVTFTAATATTAAGNVIAAMTSASTAREGIQRRG